MSSTDNRTEIRYVCGKPIRVTHSIDVFYYGEYGQKFVTYYWEDAEIGVMQQHITFSIGAAEAE